MFLSIHTPGAIEVVDAPLHRRSAAPPIYRTAIRRLAG
jgi:hypothetical protein